jgi:haloacetate dehalogenase
MMEDDTESQNAAVAGIDRRSMFQALAAGAAGSGVVVSQAFAQNPPGIANAADYVRDPNRWGTAEVAALFPGFQHLDMKTSGAVIRVRHGGSGPPLLLMHGNPESHVTWYKIAARLSQRYHVVLPDLRGYGDSSLPEAGPNHINYSFRAFAQDNVEVMEQLGYRRYFVAGHDRGGRTTFRMCLDHPERVIKATIMDVLPNYHVWTNTSKEWALASWHWLFMAQPEPSGTHDERGRRRILPAQSHVHPRRHGPRLPNANRFRRICPSLHPENDYRFLSRLSRRCNV